MFSNENAWAKHRFLKGNMPIGGFVRPIIHRTAVRMAKRGGSRFVRSPSWGRGTMSNSPALYPAKWSRPSPSPRSKNGARRHDGRLGIHALQGRRAASAARQENGQAA